MYNTFTQQENQPLFAFRHGEEARNEGDLNYSTHDESEDSLSDDVYTDSDTDFDEQAEEEKLQRNVAREQRFIDMVEADAEEHPLEPDEDDIPECKLLKRDLQAQALKRIEDAARTPTDFQNVIAWWDRLDANRQRKERYHEICRSGNDIPLDYRVPEDALYFPDTLNNALLSLERKGDFIDSIFYCPLDIHQHVSEEYMSKILQELPVDHKFLLSFWALRQLSSAQIATIRGQSDRNIRKVRRTMLNRIRKKLLSVLTEKAKYHALTLLEKNFLTENGVTITITTAK